MSNTDQPAPPHGLTFQVVRPAPSRYGDLTLGGVSATADTLTVVGTIDPDGDFQLLPRDARVFPARPDAPAVVLDRTAGGHPILVPAAYDHTSGEWGRVREHVMAGGNYAAYCDSRASDAVESVCGHRFYGAVAVHDRIEHLTGENPTPMVRATVETGRIDTVLVPLPAGVSADDVDLAASAGDAADALPDVLRESILAAVPEPGHSRELREVHYLYVVDD
ncbi:hypothetical protein [Dietzia sp. 179-F 9C3 NHS]|uniref:hypothetical protein n=1 Tax=Dietzia sp. 179-F 9C3 NHS TaxID=3374295 RepID=UPI00387A5B59